MGETVLERLYVCPLDSLVVCQDWCTLWYFTVGYLSSSYINLVYTCIYSSSLAFGSVSCSAMSSIAPQSAMTIGSFGLSA